MDIKQILQKQQQTAEQIAQQSGLSEKIEISTYNNNRIVELTDTISAVINKNNKAGDTKNIVWNDFHFGEVSGAITGFLRTAFLNVKYRREICGILNIPTLFIDEFYKHSGKTPYAKDGEVTEAVKMDIPAMRNLVLLAGSKMQLIVSKDDLDMINEINEEARNNYQRERAENYIQNNYNTNVVVNNGTSEAKVNSYASMMESLA